MSIKDHKITNTWQKSDYYTDNYTDFLIHEREPIDSHKSFTVEEIKQELYENRYYLKRRVWRNIRKIRRHSQIQNQYSEPVLKVFKPHHAR